MNYDSNKILVKIDDVMEDLSPSEKKHVLKLKEMADGQIHLKDIFEYGIEFLPNITDEAGKKNLDLLKDYKSDILPYYEILTDCGLEEKYEDLATDLMLYANGTSLEIDSDMYAMDPKARVESCFALIK